MASVSAAIEKGKEESDQEKYARGSRYLKAVKDTFADRPYVSLRFMQVLTLYQGKQLTVDDAVEEVAKLFEHHPGLFDEFLGFVGPSYTGARQPSYSQKSSSAQASSSMYQQSVAVSMHLPQYIALL
jgi:histone deacetylase complex regulatory component SIN3